MSDYKERIYNTIFIKQNTINKLKKLHDMIDGSHSQNVRFRVETKHWYGYGTDLHEGKERTEIPISKEIMNEIISIAIERETEYINKLIDMEVEVRLNDK